jgi:hypothetical protein
MGSLAPEIVRIALRRARSFGASSLASLAASAAEEGLRVSKAQARETLARDAHAEFLDDDWFWLPGEGNRLETLSRRILSVAAPLDVATIRAGVCRTYGGDRAALVPPAAVMDAFYEAHASFVLDAQGRVGPAEELDHRLELGPTDRMFVDVLRSSWTGVLDRRSFHDGCLAAGMTATTFNLLAPRSPVLDDPADGVWCLRGTRVSPITAAALRHAKALDEL